MHSIGCVHAATQEPQIPPLAQVFWTEVKADVFKPDIEEWAKGHAQRYWIHIIKQYALMDVSQNIKFLHPLMTR